MQSISDLDKNMLAQVQEFFVSCNKQRGKKFKVTGTGGPNKAIKFVPKAVDAVRRPDSHSDQAVSSKSAA